MSKLSYENKINLHNDRKKGLSKKSVSIKHNISIPGAQYLCCLIDKHGFDIVRKNKNNKYSNEFKLEATNRCLNNNKSVWSVALDIGLSGDGMLHNWINKYKENGYNIVERKRGRSPTMTKEKEIKENIHLKKVLWIKLLIIILIVNSMQISQMKNGIQIYEI